MAFIVADRVQELTTTSGTGTLTLNGAVNGFQTFSSGIGNSNTTFYTIYDPVTYAWEVGIGTVGSGTLSRDTVLANSLGTTVKINLAGNAASVFCTYPAEKSVNLDASGNVTPLGTIASGTWQGTTVGVAYGGTGVTTSSGANSVMLRDADQNVQVNRIAQARALTTASGGTTNLTAASAFVQTLIGTGPHTFRLPDATTIPVGTWFLFDNDSTGLLSVEDFGLTVIDTVSAGGYVLLILEDASSVAGIWIRAGLVPHEVNWGTNSLDLGGSTVITNGTWEGDPVDPAYGGTGLASFVAANNALYSTGATTLTAGTLPVAAGGTGLTSLTANYVPYGNGTSPYQSSSTFTYNGTTLDAANISTPGNLTFTGTGNRITGDFNNATFANRVAFQNSVTNAGTNVTILPNGTAPNSGVQVFGNSDPTNASRGIFQVGSTDVRVDSSITGTGSYLPMTFYTGGSERMRIDTSGNVGIGGTPATALDVIRNVAASGPVIRAYNSDTGATSSAAIQVQQGAVTSYFSSYGNVQGTLGTASSHPMVFVTANTEKMRITSNGGIAFNGSTNYGSSGQVLTSNGDAPPTWTTISASGDVTGPASATDNAIARFDGTTGKIIQNSAVTIDDTTGTMTFTGSSARIIGAMTNAGTTDLKFQTSVANSPTYLQVIPSGTSGRTGLFLRGQINTARVAYETQLELTTPGNQDIVFTTNNTSERLRILENGAIAFNGSTNYGSSGQVLTSQGNAPPTWVSLPASGTVTSVSAGNGMNFTTITGSGSVTLGTPSDITSTSTNSAGIGTHSHALNNTGVTAGSYTNASITVDAKGRITTASSGAASGTVTSVAAGNGMSFTTITGSGTVTMGTPSNISNTTTNSVSAGTHTHALTGELVEATSGSALYYGARAFVLFDASSGTPTITDSQNVLSITDRGVGLYTIVFPTATAFSTANYVCGAIAGRAGNQATTAQDYNFAAPTTTTFPVRSSQVNGTLTDSPYNSYVFFE